MVFLCFQTGKVLPPLIPEPKQSAKTQTSKETKQNKNAEICRYHISNMTQNK